ncbi:MAG: 3-isopropylmalate dehydratase large subunit [Gammaproteobacteria bacterium]
MSKTLFEKIWADHLVRELQDGTCLLLVDRIFLHERTGSMALQGLEDKRRPLLDPGQVFCTMDHIVDTRPGRTDDTLMPGGKEFITTTRKLARNAGITLFDLNDPEQGIMHIVAAEQGIALPGTLMVCPDSHSCTLGALGALAWGIGSSDCEHAMATRTLRVNKPRQMLVRLNGVLGRGVTAKDIILHLIARYGTAGGAGYVLEFTGEVIDSLSIEARFTLCNMAVEFSAFSGLIAADEQTFAYLKDRPYAPKAELWEQAVKYWRSLASDPQARFDKVLDIDCDAIAPTVTWGTSPQHGIAIDGRIPDPEQAQSEEQKQGMYRALDYMGLNAGEAIAGTEIDAAFIGSCTNSRLSDLRAAAEIVRGEKVEAGIRAICVPGSSQVKKAAEAEGLDQIFIDAGFEWRESGCSMCFYAGGEGFGDKQRVISTTNRNFEGRQGRGARTHLASPATVAKSAIAGCISDPRMD